MTVEHPRIRFGAAYYHEYHHPGEDPSLSRLKSDLDQMVDAGFTTIRVGESVWSTWEPEAGVFDLDWLEPVLNGAHERGIDVILGTPTYAVPQWLVRRYPEIAGESRTGHSIGWGARQEADFTHPAFRFHAERLLRRIVERYSDHPAVVGYQVDNEPGLYLFHNHGVFQRFVDELRTQYRDVETLNREWGLVYWSHRLSTWADLWKPDGNAQPQYDLAWRRFQARLTTEMIEWQAQVVRGLARRDQWVTTCISYDRPALDDVELGRVLDVTAGNPYYGMQDELQHPDGIGNGNSTDPLQAWTVHGAWALVRDADHMWSTRGEEFLVTETNAQAIGGPHSNHPAYPGQWRQAAWALVARGARMIEYWHWNTLHYGAETYWGGVLPHSGRTGRTYREISALGAELARFGPMFAGAVPDADIAILYGQDARFALAGQPALPDVTGEPDPRAYPRIVSAFYRAAFDAGLQVRLLRPALLWDRQPQDVATESPVLVVAGWYPAEDRDLQWLTDYAAAGGHLVVGPRTGYADGEARARADIQPAGIARAAGAWYEEFSNLRRPVRVTATGVVLEGLDEFTLPSDAIAVDWADGLIAGLPVGEVSEESAADVLATYDHPFFSAFAAVTTRPHGDGRITVVGTLPGRVLGRALAAWLVPVPCSGWSNLPPSVTVHTSTRPDGTRVHVVHNWSWDEVTLEVPAELELLTGAGERGGEGGGEPGDRLRLGPWDVALALRSR